MKKKHFLEEQITYVLPQESTGEKVAEICRRLGVSQQTFYRWKKRVALHGFVWVSDFWGYKSSPPRWNMIALRKR